MTTLPHAASLEPRMMMTDSGPVAADPLMTAGPTNQIAAPLTIAPTPLTGAVIGTAGSYKNAGNTIAKAFDGNINSFFDGPAANANWCGLDLGGEFIISRIDYAPRSNAPSRMVNGLFQGANVGDFSDAINLYLIASVPAVGVLNTAPVTVATPFRFVRYLSPAGSYGNIAEMQVFGTPAVINPPGLYFSASGNDGSNGDSPAMAKRTVTLVDGQHEFLEAGDTFAPIRFDGHSGVILSSYGTGPKPIIFATGSSLCTAWDVKTKNCALSNVTLSSAGGNIGGRVRGDGNAWVNVDFSGLSDACIVDGATNFSIINCHQTGTVKGRCLYVSGAKNLIITGGTFGHSDEQSPGRFSSPATDGAVITGVTFTQVGSSFPIAGCAVHALLNATFTDCVCEGGEFSIDGAGAGVGDIVKNVTINNLTVHNAKFNLGKIASNVKVNGGTFTNLNGEAIDVNCLPNTGNVIDGGSVYTESNHAVVFHQKSDCIIKNLTVYTHQTNLKILDGLLTYDIHGKCLNDGEGNKIVLLP